jgi:hypothetical protein
VDDGGLGGRCSTCRGAAGVENFQGRSGAVLQGELSGLQQNLTEIRARTGLGQ